MKSLLNRVGSRRFRSTAGWTLSASVAGPLAGLLLIYLITRLVDPIAFGRASLINGFVALISSLLVAPLLTDCFRSHFRYFQQGQVLLVLRLLRWSLVKTVGGACLVYVVIAVAYYYFGGESLYLAFSVPALLLLIATPLPSLVNYSLEAQAKFRAMTVVNLVSRLLPVIALVPLLLLFAAEAAILLSAVAGTLGALFGFGLQRGPANPVTGSDKDKIASARPDVLHLYIATLTGWVMTTLPRYVLDFTVEPRDIGVFVANAGVVALPFGVVNHWLELLTRRHTYDCVRRQDWAGVRSILRHRLLITSLVTILGAGGLAAFGVPIMRVVVGSYAGDFYLICFLAIGQVAVHLGNCFVPVYLAAGKSRFLVFAGIPGAAVTILITLLCAELIGATGAAIGVACGYAVWSGVLWLNAASLSATLERRGLCDCARLAESVSPV